MGQCDVAGLLPVEQAIERMLSVITPISTAQTIALSGAAGFVLSDDVRSPISVPPFDNAAMDGYAVRLQELQQNPVLPVAGKSFAGAPFNDTWPPETCIRIMTGAKIPAGCDAVIMQEKTRETDHGIEFQHTTIKPMQNIRPTGDDIKKSAVILKKGHRLTLRDIPLLASVGLSNVTVYSKPKVAYFSTGDELRSLGAPLEDGQIYDINRYMIGALIEKFGAEPIDLGIIPDSPERLKATFIEAQSQADIVITSGGVSVGEADFTKNILEEVGEIGFWKLAIKPGKPFAFGKLDNAFFCGLPGNPSSAFVTMYTLVQPAIAKLAGHSEWQPVSPLPAIAKKGFKKSPGRTDYKRGYFTVENGQFYVTSAGNQSSGAFTAMSQANCFVVLEKERGNVDAGETVHIEPFNTTLY